MKFHVICMIKFAKIVVQTQPYFTKFDTVLQNWGEILGPVFPSFFSGLYDIECKEGIIT